MKLEHPIKLPEIPGEPNCYLEYVCPQKAGLYLIFRIENVKRGIKGKTRGKVDELLIHGIPWSQADRFCKKYGIIIEEDANE